MDHVSVFVARAGLPLQNVAHVNSHRSLFSAACQEILHPVDRDAFLPILLGTFQGGAAMARFLKTMRASMAPRRVREPVLTPSHIHAHLHKY
jgi:hypothetical protein